MKNILILVLTMHIAVSSAFADTAQIKVRSTAIRSQPKIWSSSIGLVSYGDSVALLGSQSGWMKVKSGGKEGYLHSSALTSKKIVLSSSKHVAQQADRSDIVMAGKGFSKSVEAQFAAVNGSLNFKAVDEVERQRVKAGDLAGFIKGGKLNG